MVDRSVGTVARLLLALASASVLPAAAAPPRTMAEILAASRPEEWRRLDPDLTVRLELPQGVVLIELDPRFAPRHVDNLRVLIRARYFDGLAITRVQDNFVVQWGDPEAERPEGRRDLGAAEANLPPEFSVPWQAAWPFLRLPDGDGYAARVGFSRSLPVAQSRDRRTAWRIHCYGTVGVGRDTAPDSGNGAELYVVIGHAPRQLDRNVAVVGQVRHGIEHLSALPRGSGALGFFADPRQRIPIRRLVFERDLAPAERLPLEVLDSSSPSFAALIEARRNRRDAWYHQPAGHIDVCNVPLPVRRVDAE